MADEVVLKGWTTYGELRDNLIEYMVTNSTYANLAGEELPTAMRAEMESSMGRLAQAIFREISEAGSYSGWKLFIDNLLSKTVIENTILNLISGEGIKLSVIESENPNERKITISVSEELVDSVTYVQRGVLTNLDSYFVNKPFSKSFIQIPYVEKFDVYRVQDLGGGRYRRKTVAYYYATPEWPTKVSFNIEIYPSEPLEGVIIDYKFIEQ